MSFESEARADWKRYEDDRRSFIKYLLSCRHPNNSDSLRKALETKERYERLQGYNKVRESDTPIFKDDLKKERDWRGICFSRSGRTPYDGVNRNGNRFGFGQF